MPNTKPTGVAYADPNFEQIFLNGTEMNETNLSGVTASAAEVNVLDGMTASTAELNKLDGMTASTAELSQLDGIGAVIANAAAAEAVIADPAGGATTDAEARTAINAIIDALQAFGIVAT